jgi:hypothetical protein
MKKIIIIMFSGNIRVTPFYCTVNEQAHISYSCGHFKLGQKERSIGNSFKNKND